jgi:hypothetical protein
MYDRAPTLPPDIKGVIVIRKWDQVIVWLTLVRIGQDLGSDSPVARAIHTLISAAISLALK